jgi:hypothetical protein
LKARLNQRGREGRGLYRNEEPLEQSVEHLRVVETLLLKNTAEYFRLPSWGDFFEEYFLMRRLMSEKRLYVQSTPTSVTESLYNSVRLQQDKFQQFTKMLDSYIVRAGQSVRSLFAADSRFEDALDPHHGEPFLETGNFRQLLAEEG